jgi:hypothetical protein
MRLDIGDIAQWFRNPVLDPQRIAWYPRNFTNPMIASVDQIIADNPARYSMGLGLYIIGYKEARDDSARKFIPQHRVLARYDSIDIALPNVSSD